MSSIFVSFEYRLVRLSTHNHGQIEIDLIKQIEQKWSKIGKFLPTHLSVFSAYEFGKIELNISK